MIVSHYCPLYDVPRGIVLETYIVLRSEVGLSTHATSSTSSHSGLQRKSEDGQLDQRNYPRGCRRSVSEKSGQMLVPSVYGVLSVWKAVTLGLNNP